MRATGECGAGRLSAFSAALTDAVLNGPIRMLGGGSAPVDAPANPGAPEGDPTSGSAGQRFVATGLRVRTPAGARSGTVIVEPEDAASGLPTVVVYHGSNQRGSSLRAATRGSFDQLARHGLARVAYPTMHRAFWHPSRGIDDVAELRDAAAAAGAGPVIAVGYSDGGFFVSRLLHEAPELLRGAVLLNATQLLSSALAGPTEHPVPVLLMAGTADPIVPYSGGSTSSWGLQRRGRGMPVPAAAEYFAGRNGIHAAAVTDRMPHHPRSQGTWVERRIWREHGREPVELVTVHGGGHLVPSGALSRLRSPLGRSTLDVVAADEVATFFGLAG